MTQQNESLALDDAEAAVLMDAVRPLIETLGLADLRRLMLAVYRRWMSTGYAESMLVVVHALRACAEDCKEALDESQPAEARAAYERWREQQERPDEWPSGPATRRAFPQWTLAIRAVAGDRSSARQKVKQRLNESEGYTSEDLLRSLRAWIAEGDEADKTGATGDETLTFSAYAAWGRAYLARHPDALVPLHPTHPIRFFGGWRQAVVAADAAAAARAGLVHAGGEIRRQRQIGARRAERDAWIVAQIRAAADDLGLRLEKGTDWTRSGHSYLSKSRYDRWATEQREMADSNEALDTPPHSRNIVKRFGSWQQALDRAAAQAE